MTQWSTVDAVVVGGVHLGYREAGDPGGHPAVLVHGTGSSSGTWDRFAARLAAAGHRVVAVDLRGHATSARTGDYALGAIRDDLLGVMAALGLRDALVVGHSVGGYAALAAAVRRPYRISRLVLEDLAAPPRRRTPVTSGAHRLLTGVAALAARRDRPLGAMASIFAQLARPDPRWWARLGEVRQPALVLSGGPASCIPPRRLAEVAAAMPDARLATIPVGHRIHSLAPDAFHAEVSAFLAAADAADADTAEAAGTAADAAGTATDAAGTADAGGRLAIGP